VSVKMKTTTMNLDNLCVNTVRILAADAVEKATSGHPGGPMGIAPMAYVLWSRFLKHNPKNPKWANRDRFILSAGHASMLQYSLLHLTGYGISLEDIHNFRQWGSLTAGHPEYGLTPGVETTTGPLGQGFSNAVGMALAERIQAAYFNRPGHQLVDHNTYVIVSDGDIMEGISHEASSLAGHLKLGKLICLYDDNEVTIDGKTNLTFSENVKARFEAVGWHVEEVANGDEDLDAIEKAIQAGRQETTKPSLVIVKTTIAYGSPTKRATAASHGAPLGTEEVRLTKKELDWPEDEHFHVPQEARREFEKAIPQGKKVEEEWNALWKSYASKFPDLAKDWKAFLGRELPQGWEKDLPTFKPEEGPMATRAASGKTLNEMAKIFPNLLSGSADLSDSVNTTLKGLQALSADHPQGRNIHFGVREHAMAAMVNGMTLHGGVIVVAGTFLIFSDYMKPSIRLAALMGIPSIFVFSHDSIGLGEDGPTHQPIEQLATLRSTPNLVVIRPGDANEARGAWRAAMERKDGPTAIVLTRQKLPVLQNTASRADENVKRGAYVLEEESRPGKPDLILMATGSEVSLVVDVKRALEQKKISTRVVSMPSWELFNQQTDDYRRRVLPPEVKKRLSVEVASPMGWHAYVGSEGDVVGLDHFGASAPAEVLMKEFGFTVENIVDRALKLLKK